MEELEKNGGTCRRNCSQNRAERAGKPFPTVFWHLLKVRGCLSTAADSIGAAGRRLVGMTVRMRWNGQGFGNVLIKPGIDMKVTWVTGFPKEIRSGRLLWGQAVELRSLLPRCPQRQNQGTGQKS